MPDNIVAACRFCNSRRHRTLRPLPPQDYAHKVQQRLASGKWRGLRLEAGADGPGLPGLCVESREIAAAAESCC